MTSIIGQPDISIDNTNAKHLELYSIMGEHDNAGFPLTYCLLSTTTAIDQGKRTKALMAWSCCLRDLYGVEPTFIHTDKDMAEIGCSKAVWKAKINLCWWHLRRAVRTRLAKAKLSTTAYNMERAREEYAFISTNFKPAGTRVDDNDYEGGSPDINLPPTIPATTEAAITPPPTEPTVAVIASQPQQPLGDVSNLLRIKLQLPQIASAVGRVIQGVGFRLVIAPTHPMPNKKVTEDGEDAVAVEENDPTVVSDEDEGKEGHRTFCPAVFRDSVVNMIERHYCAHPLIPGYGPPDAIGIKRWAVQQMYNFCFKHELPEVWAYLWENWYRKGRWELWARCAHELIPILKTTMILESQ